MIQRARFIAALPRTFLLLGCMVLLAAWRIGPPLTYFEEDGAIAKAIADIRAAGAIERVLSIQISPREVQIEAQDPNNMRHINRWRLERVNIGKINWERLEGPDPVRLDLINPDLESNLFDLAEVDFGAVKTLLRDTIDRAQLEDVASVTAMEIGRQLFLLPKPSSGDVQWKVHVSSERENAGVVADAKGTIVRLNLSGTNRAKTFDLLKSLDLLPEAANAFALSAGAGPVLTEVRITSHGATFKTNIADRSPMFASLKQARTFNWNLNGLTQSMGSVDTSEFFGADPPFAIGDTDWGQAAELVRKAKDALGMAEAVLSDIEVTKPKEQPGIPQLEWEITLVHNGEEGVARFDAKGAPLGHTLPESRRKPFDARDPASWPGLLAAITGSFGGDGAISELVIHENQISVVALDPQTPGQLGNFLVDHEGIKRFGSVSPFAAENPRFSVSDLKALDEEKFRKLQEATAQRLKLTPFKISTITIGKASLDPSPQGNVTVEIRAEEAPFGRGGRVNWEIDGREIKAYLP